MLARLSGFVCVHAARRGGFVFIDLFLFSMSGLIWPVWEWSFSQLFDARVADVTAYNITCCMCVLLYEDGKVVSCFE